MQMRELRVVLLVLLWLGCGPHRLPEINDYIKKNKEFKNVDQLGFLLNTQSDSLNEVFGILAESLVDTELVQSPQSQRELEELGALSRGRWLMARARTAEAGGGIAAQYDLNTRFRRSYRSFEAALAYGMASPDSLRILEQEALESLSRLHAEYVGSSPEILDRGTSPDSVSEIASAQLRYAAMMNFGAELCAARRDADGETMFRTDANRAMRAGRNLFREAHRRYLAAQTRKPARKFPDFQTRWDDYAQSDTTDETASFEFAPPDTEAYVRAGVLNGIPLLAIEPRGVIRAEDLFDGLAWLRWNEYRMRDSLKLLETPLLDSVQALILAGPAPGYLTVQPYRPGPLSPLVMYEFVRQLSELYLGIQPNLLENKVRIEPRLPVDWGHTVARVPLAQGYLHVDYDFQKLQAEVWMENISDTLVVEFGFPYASGGWLTASFILTRSKDRQLIQGVINGGRLRLVLV